jgi:hypothetical protein
VHRLSPSQHAHHQETTLDRRARHPEPEDGRKTAGRGS